MNEPMQARTTAEPVADDAKEAGPLALDTVALFQWLMARQRGKSSPLPELSTDEMAADLTMTFPALAKLPLRDFFGPPAKGVQGLWTVVDPRHVMPDGEPMFKVPTEPGPCLDRVHPGFSAWIENRGWCCSCHDDHTFWLTPMSALYQPWIFLDEPA